MEIEAKAINNRVNKTIQERSIVVTKAKDPTINRDEVSSLLINGPKKEDKGKGMDLEFGKKGGLY